MLDATKIVTIAHASACYVFSEWPTLAVAVQPAPLRWDGSPPDAEIADVEYQLGYVMTDEQAHLHAVAFANEWARQSDLAAGL